VLETVARRRRRKLPVAMVIGISALGVVLMVAAFGPMMAPYHFSSLGIPLQKPGGTHLFGTDDLGRDVFSRVLVGARGAIAYGVFSAIIAVTIGSAIGLYSGYKGGKVDESIMRALDIIMSIPAMMLALLLLSLTSPSIVKAIVAVGVITTPSMARIARSVVLGLRSEEFIQAARTAGESTRYILMHEILPNYWPIAVVEAALRVTFGILLGASLSFLGFGAQPPSADWGLMLADARPLISIAPWIALAPALAMSFTTIGMNLFGFGLRDYLDPKTYR
jgi:peptide/nickel transport system permease protein